jgi:glycosyltransferase involved in cell wall biosynthesis
MAMHAPDETIIVSQSLTQELSAKYARPARYIPNGITLEGDEDDSILEELGLEPQRYVLFASRLVPEKGAHYLAQACRHPRFDMALVMAGDSSFSGKYVEDLRAACSRQNVLFPGYVYGPRLSTLFRHAALFVLPSDVEGLPIVLLEALGYGTPVLASDIPPNREVLAGLGRTFRAGDVEDLQLQLESALADLPALKEEASSAAAAIRAAYDWDVVADETLAVYQASLARR